jgi:hypothetical protein
MKKVLSILILVFFVHRAFAQNNVAAKFEDFTDRVLLRTVPDLKENKKIKLEWNSNLESDQNFYAVERSFNSKDFETIGLIRGRSLQSTYFFTDENPSSKNNFYRIRVSFPDGKIFYSRIISCGIAPEQFCKFYPNPVERILILRPEATVEIRITDQSGKNRINRLVDQGLQLLDVSALEKGFYVITIYQRQSNRVITEKLVKY